MAGPEGAGGRGLLRGELDVARTLLRRHSVALALVFCGLLLPLWAFAELADEIRDGELLPFDEPVLLYARALGGEGLDRVFLFFSAIGYAWGVVPFDIALVAVLAWLRRFRDSVFAAVALAGSGLLNVAAKQFFARDRPSLWDSIAPEHNYSFPSGHAMGSMTLACVLLALAWPTRARWPVLAAMAVFVPMVGLSRIYLGVHYPSDILAGWAAAAAWVAMAWLLLLRGMTGRGDERHKRSQKE